MLGFGRLCKLIHVDPRGDVKSPFGCMDPERHECWRDLGVVSLGVVLNLAVDGMGCERRWKKRAQAESWNSEG